MTTTYIIKKQEFSEKAYRRMGNGNVWIPITKTKNRSPTDEKGFHEWLLSLVGNYGPGTYHIIRTHSTGESRGFKPVCLCDIDKERIFIRRGYTSIKSNPGFGPTRQAFFKNVPSRRRFGSRLVKV